MSQGEYSYRQGSAEWHALDGAVAAVDLTGLSCCFTPMFEDIDQNSISEYDGAPYPLYLCYNNEQCNLLEFQ